MYDILTAILYDEPFHFRDKKPLTSPYSVAELAVVNDLRKLDDGAAEELEKKIRMVVSEYRNQAFLTGVRFGAQLALELTQNF